MTGKKNILLVEDSRADARLILEVIKEEQIDVDIKVVRDGESALEYLNRTGPYSDASRPDLIILDLNLPKKDGRQVLAEVKQNSELKLIPVVILTTSQSDDDIMNSYRLQASCFVSKPIDLDQFTKIIKSFDSFWLHAVRYAPNYE